jgi:hypothetical protein
MIPALFGLRHATIMQDFEGVFRQLFVRFLMTVSPWFALDISQGCITLRLDKDKALGAEVYAHTLGVTAADDVKYVYGLQLLQAVLEIMRTKAMGRTDVEVRMLTRRALCGFCGYV